MQQVLTQPGEPSWYEVVNADGRAGGQYQNEGRALPPRPLVLVTGFSFVKFSSG